MWRKGFTLIELIVVIAIIAILAAIIAPNAFKAIEKSKTSATIGELQGIKTAALSYFADTGTYPPACLGDACGALANGFIVNATSAAATIGGWDGPYLPKWAPTSKFGGEYNWFNTTGSTSLHFNAASGANERYVEVNGTISVAVQNSIDRSVDGGAAVNKAAGELWFPNANAVEFLVSRDGPITPQ